MNLVRDYTNDKFDIVFRSLSDYRSSADPEILHRLRVALKKIKAVLAYLRTLHPGKIKPLRKKLQHIFHTAGSLREMQIRLEWLKEQKLIFLIEHFQLGIKIQEQENLFVAQAPEHLTKLRDINDELDKYLHKVDEDDMFQYAQELKRKFQQQLQNLATGEWHALRKLMKQLLYACHWLKEKDNSKVLTDEAYQQLDGLQEKIGLWHDAVDLLEWFNKEEFVISFGDLVKEEFTHALTLVRRDVVVQEQIVLKQLQAIKSH